MELTYKYPEKSEKLEIHGCYGGLIFSDGSYLNVFNLYGHLGVLHNYGFTEYAAFWNDGGIRLIYPNKMYSGLEFVINFGRKITEKQFDVLFKIIKEINKNYGEDQEFYTHLSVVGKNKFAKTYNIGTNRLENNKLIADLKKYVKKETKIESFKQWKKLLKI